MELQNSSTSNLDRLAHKYGTDKSSQHHNYVRLYEKFLSSQRQEPLTLLELGWGGHNAPELGGASAQMWRDWMPNATIVCIDIEEKTITDAHKGINFRQGSQADPEFIQSLVDEFGGFDVIVDDASHLSSLTIKSWELLYPHLRDGGLYAVEDTHMAYHDWFYGNDEANRNPRKKASGNETAIQYFKRITDDVNFKGRDSEWDLYPREYWLGYDIEAVHFYFNLILLEKRVADDPTGN